MSKDRDFFDELFGDFLGGSNFFNFNYSKITKGFLDNVEDNREEAKDYSKEEKETISDDGKYKVIKISETWTDENGGTNKSITRKTVPNVDEKVIEKEKKIAEIDAKITAAVKAEDYEKAAKLKKEKQKIK